MLDNLPMTEGLTKAVADARGKVNKHGERFNIFSILKVHRNEVGTHSRFLYELLNPRGRHGEGRAFLRLFLDNVLGLQDVGEGHYRISRELATEKNRRIDLVIESSDIIVGIELKIDALDQKAQLHDYYQELQWHAGGKRHVVLAYLTLDGKSPSPESLGTLSKEKVVCLSFADDVSIWLQRCIEISQQKLELAHAIQQYLQLIRNLTRQGGSVSDVVASELKDDTERFQEALEVEKAVPKAKASIQQIFWQDLSKALTDKFRETPIVYNQSTNRPTIASISKSYYDDNRYNKHIGLKLPICRLNGKKIYLYTHLYHAVHYGLRAEDESGALTTAQDLKAEFSKEPINGRAKADRDSNWLICFYYNPALGDAEKIINFDDFNSTAVGLLDDEIRRTLIADIVSHQVALADKAKELVRPLHN